MDNKRYDERERELDVLGLLFLVLGIGGTLAAFTLPFSGLFADQSIPGNWLNIPLAVIGLTGAAMAVIGFCAFVGLAAWGLLKDIFGGRRT